MRDLKSDVIHALQHCSDISLDKLVEISNICDKFQSRLDAAETLSLHGSNMTISKKSQSDKYKILQIKDVIKCSECDDRAKIQGIETILGLRGKFIIHTGKNGRPYRKKVKQ